MNRQLQLTDGPHLPISNIYTNQPFHQLTSTSRSNRADQPQEKKLGARPKRHIIETHISEQVPIKITNYYTPIKRTKHTRRGSRGGRKKSRPKPHSKTNKKRSNESQTSDKPKKESTKKIFNLSSHILNSAEYSLLNKGLSFCPTEKINDFQLFIDLNSYIQKLTLARHFATTKSQVQNDLDHPLPNLIPNPVTPPKDAEPFINSGLLPKSNF